MCPKSLLNVNPKVHNSHEIQDTLHSISQLKKIIECALITPYIKNEKPLSLLIVAKPESGKTTVMKLYAGNKGIVYVTDCTAYGIQRDLLPKLVSKEIRTIVIADLLTPLSKAFKTKQSFIAFLNNLIEEGVAKITTYAMTWDKEVKANIITAVTDQAIEDGRHEWAKLGFLSRFIIFSYSYSMSAVMEILSSYSRHGLTNEPIEFPLPTREADIELSTTIADKLDPIAMKIGEQFQLHGIRAKINLRSLIKALACRNGSKTVTENDYAELVELADYMNFEYHPLR